MRIYILLVFVIGILPSSFSQTLPAPRATDWTLAGLRDTSTAGFVEIDMIANGAIGDGITPNDAILTTVLNNAGGPGLILNFGPGNFLFTSSLLLPNNTVIRGQGAATTTLSLNLSGGWHTIRIEGSISNTDTSSLIAQANKDSLFIEVNDASAFNAGDWIKIIDDDAALVSSPWAIGHTGQIIQIAGISGNKLILHSALRRTYLLSNSPHIKKLIPRKNIGIECLKIQRLDNAAPNQSSNIYFKNAVNCWISGVESFNCTYSHVEVESSSNIKISTSYFHHGFEYGDGGRAYGVMLHFATGETRVENNIFEHLRHSMILQAGANGNVFAYNYSYDPYWTSTPNNSAGDMVLHGNYPYLNFFEQNICQNIVIDNSHGPNGPFNTFFRNRAESYGIYFSAANSPNQNLIGNEITNLNFPYNLINYTIQGSGHFIHGNNNKGVITPSGTGTLPDLSYAYASKPSFIPQNQWAGIGTPNNIGSKSIPAKDRFTSGNIFGSACMMPPVSTTSTLRNPDPVIYPNPFTNELNINFNKEAGIYYRSITIRDIAGRIIYMKKHFLNDDIKINSSTFPSGIYSIELINDSSVFRYGLIRIESH